MPCRTYDDDRPRTEYINGVDPVPYEKQIKELEAGLCAVFSELEKRKIAIEVIEAAQKNGDIDLKPFWMKHKKEDLDRLAKKFTAFMMKFSEHEQNVIRQIAVEQAKRILK